MIGLGIEKQSDRESVFLWYSAVLQLCKVAVNENRCENNSGVTEEKRHWQSLTEVRKTDKIFQKNESTGKVFQKNESMAKSFRRTKALAKSYRSAKDWQSLYRSADDWQNLSEEQRHWQSPTEECLNESGSIVANRQTNKAHVAINSNWNKNMLKYHRFYYDDYRYTCYLLLLARSLFPVVGWVTFPWSRRWLHSSCSHCVVLT